MMKRGASLKAAASANRISQERLRRYLRENTEAMRVGKVWKILDWRRFHLPIYSRGRIVEVWLSADEASKAGEYLSAVGRFLPTGDASQLKSFMGDGVRDLTGAFHPFETGPNTLYRLDSTGELSVPEIYKIRGWGLAMEEFERKLKRAGFRNRQEARRASAHIEPQRKARRAYVVREKLKGLGLQGAVCLGCGSSDLSTFEFDHIAGRKHDGQLWPLCEVCHQEKTFMGYLEPPVTPDPANPLEVWGRQILAIAQYLRMMIRYLENHVISLLQCVGEWLIEMARNGYDKGLVQSPT
jgi:5-methylcytosine-specific restriction endonuclease McrA